MKIIFERGVRETETDRLEKQNTLDLIIELLSSIKNRYQCRIECSSDVGNNLKYFINKYGKYKLLDSVKRHRSNLSAQDASHRNSCNA